MGAEPEKFGPCKPLIGGDSFPILPGIQGVCLGKELFLFSDISQNSKLEKRSLHVIQNVKNGLFTLFSM